MNWSQLDTQILIIAVLSSVVCALPGNFLVLRKMSLLGDAISHAILPGIAIAFIVTQSRQSPLLFVGAVVSGVLVATLSKLIQQRTNNEESASLGAVFSILFAIGLVLIHFGAEAVDLDPSCVLYGALELSPLDTITLGGGWEVPRSLPRLLAVLFLNTVVITLFYKELNISSFDPAFARNSGIRTELLNYVFTALIAITTVAVFELVGSILVIAMLVAPAATAFLFCRHLSVMIPVSIGVAVVSAVGGYFLALTVPPLVGVADTTIAGVIAALAGAIYMGGLGVRGVLTHRQRSSVAAAAATAAKV